MIESVILGEVTDINTKNIDKVIAVFIELARLKKRKLHLVCFNSMNNSNLFNELVHSQYKPLLIDIDIQAYKKLNSKERIKTRWKALFVKNAWKPAVAFTCEDEQITINILKRFWSCAGGSWAFIITSLDFSETINILTSSGIRNIKYRINLPQIFERTPFELAAVSYDNQELFIFSDKENGLQLADLLSSIPDIESDLIDNKIKES